MFVAAGGAGHAADANPADELLDRARAAITSHEFSGVVRYTWWDGRNEQHRDTPVVARDGALRVAGGEVVGDGARAWMRDRGSWSALWTDRRDPHAPSLSAKYSVSTNAGPPILGRTTRTLRVRQGGHDVERITVDQSTGLVLRRDLFDGGRPVAQTEFVSLENLSDRTGSFTPPHADGAAPVPTTTTGGPRRLGHGFVLVGAQRMGDQRQLQYTDGLFDASVFVRDAQLDWSKLPAGGRDTHLGSVRVREYRTPEGSVIAWQSGHRTYTYVTDAPRADQVAVVTDLSRQDDSGWAEVARFLTAPFRWV